MQAYAFGAYATLRNKNKLLSAPNPVIRAFRKLFDFIKRAGNIFRKNKINDVKDIFVIIDTLGIKKKDQEIFNNRTNGEFGDAKDFSKLINKLNELDIVKRPLHCSDAKKETIYIKDDDTWEKEDQDNPKLKNALDKLTKKSIDAMPCMENNPDEYVKTIAEVLKDPREDKKIISKLVKEILV